jgi:hypothetical protein
MLSVAGRLTARRGASHRQSLTSAISSISTAMSKGLKAVEFVKPR